jgi:hypothetical protein
MTASPFTEVAPTEAGDPTRTSRATILRARQLRLLVRPTARASEWLAPVAGSVIAVAVDYAAGRISSQLGLELAAIALALGVAFALDDPAAPSLAASPIPLGLRHVVRAACALPLPIAVWLVLVLLSSVADRSALTLVLAGFITWALATAAVGMRIGDSGGLIAAPAVLALGACAFLLPERVSLYPTEGREGAFVAAWALVFGLTAAMGIAASRDPACRRRGGIQGEPYEGSQRSRRSVGRRPTENRQRER